MNNINCNPSYQAYRSYNLPSIPQQPNQQQQHQQPSEPEHHHFRHQHSAYNQQHQQVSQRKLPSELPPPQQQQQQQLPLQATPTQTNYPLPPLPQQQIQQQQQPTPLQQLTTAADMLSTHNAMAAASAASAASHLSVSASLTTSSNFAQNPYQNPNYTNYNAVFSNANNHYFNSSNNILQKQQQQQHLKMQLQQRIQAQQQQRGQYQPQNRTEPEQQLNKLEQPNKLQQQQPCEPQQQQPQYLPLQQPAQSAVTAANSTATDKLTMDASEIANFLANELFMQQLVSLDGIQSGVPTQTTATLTPTTLRSIEETFTQLISEPISAPYQAGFIPPPLGPFSSTAATSYNGSMDFVDTDSEDSQNSYAQLNEENSTATTDNSSAADSASFQNGLSGFGNNSLGGSNTSSTTNDFSAVNIAIAAAAAASAAKNGGINSITSNSASHSTVTPTPTRRNQGGRRPMKSANMSPEEEEKRRIRRERNKLAAARCRKRRVDQTNELLDEVAQLEKKREQLQKDITMLNTTKQDLEYILEAHRPTCQKIRQDLLSVSTYGGLIAPTNSNSNDSGNSNITGLDTTLASTGRSASPLDLKPILLNHESMLADMVHIKHEPLDSALDSNSSLDHDGPPSPKRMLLSNHNPMIPPPLPNVATLSASLAAAASASLNTPIVTTAPVSFGSFVSNNATLNALNALNKPNAGGKPRPNSLPTMPRNLAQSLALQVDGKPPTDINGVAIQTPSTGMFNFDSLMDGGTGLTPVSGPLVPTCSSQNKHPLELQTPTSEPSKLVSL